MNTKTQNKFLVFWQIFINIGAIQIVYKRKRETKQQIIIIKYLFITLYKAFFFDIYNILFLLAIITLMITTSPFITAKI